VIIRLVAWLLYHANRNPNQGFYQLKDKILKRYGKRTGYEIQHIKKECWTCNGSGVYPYPSFTQTCLNCGGTGIYSEFWVQLGVYRLGWRSFHIPETRFLKDPKMSQIEGLIRHNHKPYLLSKEATLWLWLIFEPSNFLTVYAFGKHSYRFSLYPLLFVLWCGWKVKGLREWAMKDGRKIKRLDLRGREVLEDDIPF
jgi:hypothetical protein